MFTTYFWDENTRFVDAERMTDFVNTTDNTQSQGTASLNQSDFLQMHMYNKHDNINILLWQIN